MLRKIPYIIFSICLVLILISSQTQYQLAPEYDEYTKYLPSYPLTDFPLPTIFYSPKITTKYIINHTSKLKRLGFKGFIIGTLPSNWDSEVTELEKYKKECLIMNRSFKHNFLRIKLSEGPLPKWDDWPAWEEINKRIRIIAAFAKEAKFKGLLLDTKAYNPAIWNPKYWSRYVNVSETKAKEAAYQRAREIMESIQSIYPESELLLTPAGIYVNERFKTTKYSYWIDFFNGLTSIDREPGIILITEGSFFLYDDTLLSEMIKRIKTELIPDNIDDPKYWFKKCSLALSSWPLGQKPHNKKRLLTKKYFKINYNLLQKYSEKYVFIFSEGQAWWQLTSEEEALLYDLDPEEAILPQDQFFNDYVTILKSVQDPYLKLFYKQKKYGYKTTYFDHFLIEINESLKRLGL